MTSDRIDQMRKEAERVHESAMYSAQTQFEYSKSWRRVDRWLGGLAALLAAISAAAGLSEVVSSRWAGVVALCAAGVGAVGASRGAPKAKDRAHSAANALLAVQQDARIFINVDLPSLDEGEARDQLQTLVARTLPCKLASRSDDRPDPRRQQPGDAGRGYERMQVRPAQSPHLERPYAVDAR